ncbi:MAG: carboxypeptidase regulatory-like domain-containing protein, partial [Deltaproteobacteria bacterium]
GCIPLTVAEGETSTTDFALNPAASTGTVSGTVSITGGSAETAATLSFRQTISCGEASEPAEVATLSIANGGTYSIVLPSGSYTLVVSAEGAETQSHDFQVTADAETPLDLAL